MAYHDVLKKSLIKWLGKDRVVFMPGWDQKQRGIGWKSDVPVALMAHHTAAAKTDSTNPANPGNQKGANMGVVYYVNDHFEAPASNFTLDRDGTVYVHTAYPCWHSGEGSFKGVEPYNTLGVPDNVFADYGLGVEIMSKGLKQDFTSAQKWAFGYLANATKEASGWAGFTKRLPNHKTWAGIRKLDTRYSLETLKLWATNAQKKPIA